MTTMKTCLPKAEAAYKSYKSNEWVDVTSKVAEDLGTSFGLSNKSSSYLIKSVDNIVSVIKKGIADYHKLNVFGMIKDVYDLVEDAEHLAVEVKKDIPVIEAGAKQEAKTLSDHPFTAGTELLEHALDVFCNSISEVSSTVPDTKDEL